MSSSSKPSKSILLNQPGRGDLEYICAVLNSEKEVGVRPELEPMVRRWLPYRTSQQMLAADPGLGWNLRNSFYVSVMPSETSKRFELHYPAHIIKDGKRTVRRETPKRRAIDLMLVLSTHPECDKLAGPCPRCGRYFLRKTVKQKVYCSRNCGSLASARASTLKRRNDEHAQKLLRASEAAAMWNPQNTRRGWKEFVSSKHPDMTPKFLTRAVNRGELHDPTVFQQKAVTARKGANKNA